ncbi:hypothetical protein HUE58_01450 [Candidatus Ruthia endofausta]|uniref:Uncharacterized protein n=1 Tax=Candidatus Ruthia endofausta TaxID=2738852 RepID=A0A6N0HNJ2_9GAMM|nr:hypothetical protein [Candidatus Ruthia endofausta]QKQ23875.1 hypothetical protein HUE58_01450 [Candidatus Ruthia endofausta]
MQKVIKDNENIESSYAVVLPDDCIPGILENNKEIQVIIRLLDKIDSQNH